VDDEERRKGVFGNRWFDCLIRNDEYEGGYLTDQKLRISQVIIYRYRPFLLVRLKLHSDRFLPVVDMLAVLHD
jgi:hypothetical protein